MLAAQLKQQIEKQLANTAPAVFDYRSRAPVSALSTGSAAVDEALGGGLPRGAVTEMYGDSCSGRTSAAYGALAEATRRGELCAYIDVSDAFSPADAEHAGIALSRVLWVRCCRKSYVRQERKPVASTSKCGVARRALGPLEQALKCADLILRNGGFGLVILDVGDLMATETKRVPLTSWFRFRRTIEGTNTTLLVIAQTACAVSCSSALLQFERTEDQWTEVCDPMRAAALHGKWIPRTLASSRSRLRSSLRAYCTDSGKIFSRTSDFRWG